MEQDLVLNLHGLYLSNDFILSGTKKIMKHISGLKGSSYFSDMIHTSHSELEDAMLNLRCA